MAGRTDVVATAPSGTPWIDGLLWGAHWSSGGGVTVIDTYIAGQSGAEWVDDGWGGRIYALSPLPAELAAIASAMQSFEEVCGIDFRTASSPSRAQLVWASVGAADAFGGQAWTNPPGTGTVNGKPQSLIALNQTAYQPATGSAFLARGGVDHVTILHQLGLALGLEPPHDASGMGAVLPGMTSAFDLGDHDLNQGVWTMMSYNDGWRTAPHGPSPSAQWGYQAGPMAFDIAALQAMYGANMATRTGDDTYALPSANQVGTFYSCIWDAGGADRILGAADRANTIDLRAATLADGPGAGGFLSFAAGIHGGVTIAHGAVIENATGGALADRITGNAAANRLQGLGGNDVLDGGAGADILEGGAGNDLYVLTDTDDTLIEASGGGLDEVRSALGYTLGAHFENLTLTGGLDIDGTGNAAANRLFGNAGDNVLRGLEGNDVLYGAGGTDRLEGGAGHDLYFLTGDADVIVEAPGAGTDEVRSPVSYTLGANLEYLTLTGSLDIDGTGDAAANRLFGNEGDNLLRGLGGNDVLAGYGGTDRLEGGAGHDTYFLTGDDDVIVEAPGAGTDQVRSPVTYALGANLDHLTLTGSAAIDGTGNALGNRITGNAAANLLRGLEGVDSLDGGAGADTLDGGAAIDVLRGGAGADRLIGGTGDDIFLFLSPGEGGDAIADFSNARGDDDRFHLSAGGFGGGLAAGAFLPASQLQVRADNLAQDADDRFVFRTTDATLWYDNNGSAAGGLSLLAALQAGAILTASDFYLIG